MILVDDLNDWLSCFSLFQDVYSLAALDGVDEHFSELRILIPLGDSCQGLLVTDRSRRRYRKVAKACRTNARRLSLPATIGFDVRLTGSVQENAILRQLKRYHGSVYRPLALVYYAHFR
jgi:hypothetical protein